MWHAHWWHTYWLHGTPTPAHIYRWRRLPTATTRAAADDTPNCSWCHTYWCFWTPSDVHAAFNAWYVSAEKHIVGVLVGWWLGAAAPLLDSLTEASHNKSSKRICVL